MNMSLIHESDRNAAQILGVTITRDHRPTPKTRPSILAAIKKRFTGKGKHRRSSTSWEEEEEEEDGLVWDVPNPFGPPDPELAYVHALIQKEIAHMRQFESIGPFDHVTDESEDDEEVDDAPIVLPRLLPIPLRFIPTDDDESTLPSPPPPTPSESPSDEDHPAPWADLAQVYNDLADAEEELVRKAKRDAHRSRCKALAILGPEASTVL